MNNRQRMRVSNRKVVDWLLKNGYDLIWLKPHTRRHDTVYCKEYRYYALDLYNLFDGLCWKDGKPVFLQIKTNAFAKAEPIREWLMNKSPDVTALSFNVKHKKGKRDKIEVKTYP